MPPNWGMLVWFDFCSSMSMTEGKVTWNLELWLLLILNAQIHFTIWKDLGPWFSLKVPSCLIQGIVSWILGSLFSMFPGCREQPSLSSLPWQRAIYFKFIWGKWPGSCIILIHARQEFAKKKKELILELHFLLICIHTHALELCWVASLAVDFEKRCSLKSNP